MTFYMTMTKLQCEKIVIGKEPLPFIQVGKLK